MTSIYEVVYFCILHRARLLRSRLLFGASLQLVQNLFSCHSPFSIFFDIIILRGIVGKLFLYKKPPPFRETAFFL